MGSAITGNPRGIPENIPSVCAEQLYLDYKNLVMFLLRNSAVPYWIRDDVFNTVFLKITSGLNSLSHTRNLKGWVAKITRNEIVNYFQKNERALTLMPISDLTSIINRNQEAGICDLQLQDNEVINKEITSHLCFQLQRMKKSLSQPFILRHIQEKPWDQIGKELQIKEDTARKRAEKARNLLKKSASRLVSTSDEARIVT